jgi:hypothetical protein
MATSLRQAHNRLRRHAVGVFWKSGGRDAPCFGSVLKPTADSAFHLVELLCDALKTGKLPPAGRECKGKGYARASAPLHSRLVGCLSLSPERTAEQFLTTR